MEKHYLTIVIPARNEERTIAEIVTKCKQHSDDVMVIDGHSQDKTREIAKKCGAKVYMDHSKGKGEALRCGIEKAQGEILVFIDADGSHDPDDIPRVIQPIIAGSAEHVSTSRMRGGSDELHGDFGKFLRMIGSDIITLGINYRFNVRLTDSQNGFRAIKKDVAKKLSLRENITTIEQEMIIKTLKKGYRIFEVPVHEFKRKYGESCIVLSRVWLRYVFSWLKYLLF
ncbi:MAG: glycosyltransferase family 2 protein [Candidatus Omnitrophica bacterium]|nr:glycosyltransferase family 2 protein [Candidatus Omnitrophota bacterium]